jgi:hypothetical protein
VFLIDVPDSLIAEDKYGYIGMIGKTWQVVEIENMQGTINT